MKLRLFCAALGLAAILPGADVNEIRDIMNNRVESGRAVGIVAGIINTNGRQVIAAGKTSLDGTQAPDGDTVYEIGSFTKVFTSLVLADMIEKGEVKADDPVANYLPAGTKIPSRNGREITLLDLSMQVSGLPRLPDNLKSTDLMNPYANYDAPKLYDFLARYQLTRDPGEKYEYSNLAVGLLGHALALRAGMPYDELVRRRIFEPLRMNHTSMILTEAQRKHLAPGYTAALKPAKNWDFQVLAGAGAAHSTVNDMLNFLAANLELTPSPLAAAMRRMRSLKRDTGMPDVQIGMAWHTFSKYDDLLWWHNGGTFGYRSFAGINPAKKEGAVVLCNTFFDNDDLGRHMLDSRYEVQRFSKDTQVDPKILESYVGQYELTPAFKIDVTREGSQLFVQATAQPRFEIYAKSDTEFALRAVDAQITFLKDGLILHQNGKDQKAKKVK